MALDFMLISTRLFKGVREIYPRFVVKRSKDLMIRGSRFYAIWDEKNQIWQDDLFEAIRIIDEELEQFAKDNSSKYDEPIRVLYLWDTDTKMIDKFINFCQKQMPDCYHNLNESLIFANDKPNKLNYSSRHLPYSLEAGETPAWDKLVGTLYIPEEQMKIEWAIGAIVTGASKKIQKFLVLYGSPGTGKGTILGIIANMFEGYCSVFDAESLGSNSEHNMEQLKDNPIVGLNMDGDLSKIESNTKINSIVSHEKMVINEKHKAIYTLQFLTFLILASNKYVKITDAKSGLLRRLIDVSPKGVTIPTKEYEKLMEKVAFEYGAIAYKCKEIFLSNPDRYKNYRAVSMMEESNDFFNFIEDSYPLFKRDNGTSLKSAWDLYKDYIEEAKVPYPLSKRTFKAELKNYFNDYEDRHKVGNDWIRYYYYNFKTELFEKDSVNNQNIQPIQNLDDWLDLKEQESKLDLYLQDYPAQYGNDEEKPKKAWENVKTKLKNIDTKKLHYVQSPEYLICIDFDLKDENGNKSFEKNKRAASLWPKTYAELSKGGEGIHLSYIYKGDVTKINRLYADDIEIKVFTGKSSLRRRLTKCNNEDIATISSGLPLREEKKMISSEIIKDRAHLENRLKMYLRKELTGGEHISTAVAINYIKQTLDDAYDSGMIYDVSSYYDAVLNLAISSTHQSDECIKKVLKMHFKSDNDAESINDNEEKPIVFFDIEVYPNLLLVNYKYQGKDKKMFRMINPSKEEVETLFNKYRLIGFNCRDYDNHILYARHLGYSLYDCYTLSQNIINKGEGRFGDAYNLSYTDIYDYAVKRQSLKKWEIELGIHHQEMGLPWDKPVPEELWQKVSEYCDNDVIATEAVFDHTQADFTARKILVKLVEQLHGIKTSVNEKTNTLSALMIFGREKNPKLNYVNAQKQLREEFPEYRFEWYQDPKTKQWIRKNYYKDIELGAGGQVIAEPGMYGYTDVEDVAGMHPETIIQLRLLGEYTDVFKEIRDLRLDIKHKNFDAAKARFDGKLVEYLQDKDLAKDLSAALKIVINAIYGLTSATFKNIFNDLENNKNNIVAVRGALMITKLREEVMNRGFKVIHIKTDSIKIPDATPEIIKFIREFGAKYGYTFETEHIFDRICLVNDAVYIAKLSEKDPGWLDDCKKAKEKGLPMPTRWTATGTQFQVPYVFKKCFSHESIEFKDLCETKSVNGAMYLDFNEGKEDVSLWERLKDIRCECSTLSEGIESSKVDKNGNFKYVFTKKEKELYYSNSNISDSELDNLIAKGHAYKFVGKVGLYCPIKSGCNGALLVRTSTNKYGLTKYDSVTGTSGYRWMESEEVLAFNKEKDIDISYYDSLVNKAIDSISKFGDYYWFVSDDQCVAPANC